MFPGTEVKNLGSHLTPLSLFPHQLFRKNGWLYLQNISRIWLLNTSTTTTLVQAINESHLNFCSKAPKWSPSFDPCCHPMFILSAQQLHTLPLHSDNQDPDLFWPSPVMWSQQSQQYVTTWNLHISPTRLLDPLTGTWDLKNSLPRSSPSLLQGLRAIKSDWVFCRGGWHDQV